MFSAINRKAKKWVIRQIKRRPVVLISDTTLRDGAQMPGIHLDVDARLRIAEALADAGVHSIDLGFPATGPAEVEAIQRVVAQVRGPVLSVLARTTESDIEAAARALDGCPIHKKAITLFIGTSPTHRTHKHMMSKEEVIDTAVRSVESAGAHFQLVSVGAEDASRTEPEFLHEVYRRVIQAGATSIGFADTVGILTPAKAAQAMKGILGAVPELDSALLAVHFHNDLGLATANALAAVQAGANIVQGTINGIGERAGNVALEEVIVALALHADEFGKTVQVKSKALAGLSRLVAECTGWQPADNKPVVGRNMFRTEAGIHQHGLLRNRETYLPFQPDLIGAGPVEFVLGPASGASALRHQLQAKGIEPTEELVGRLLAHLKGDGNSPNAEDELQETIDMLKEHVALGVGDPSADLAPES